MQPHHEQQPQPQPMGGAGPPGSGPAPPLPRGFFQEYLSRLRASLSVQQWEEFCGLRSGQERLAFVGRLPGSADPQWPVDLSRGMKDAAGAKAFKDRGNQAFLKGDFKASLELYTKCVLLTPFGDDLGTAEIAVATANRSAALYRLGKYRKALEDINCALSMDFPKGLKHKVLDRKARCMLALSERRKYNPEASRKARDGAMAALRETLTALDEATDLDAERRGMRETEVRMMLCVLTKAAEEAAAGKNPKGSRQQQQSQRQPPPPPVDYEEEDDDETGCGGHAGPLPPATGGRHPLYPGASQLLSFARRGAVGRQAEAKAPVAAGDVLVAEKPCVSVLLRDKVSTHCYQCFKPLLAPLPCPTCSTVAFCSAACRDAAVASHHSTECPALALFWDSGVSLTCHLALRLISQRDIQFLRDLRPHIDAAKQAVAEAEGKSFPGEGGSPDEEKFFWASELSAAQREYLSVLRLVTHEAERSPEDHFQRAVMAIFLVKCLREWTEFFEEEQPAEDGDATNGDALNEDDMLVGDLLVHHLQMMQFNAHEVFEVEMGGHGAGGEVQGAAQAADPGKGTEMISDEDTGAWRSVGLGGALYPSLVLFNHSCDPGVIRYFKGNSVIVRAIRGANPGEVVAENYGPIYTRQPRDRRQTQLRTQYWFNCECRPCKENWPLFEDMPTTVSGSMRFRCHQTVAAAPPKGAAKGPPGGQQGQVAKQKGCATGFVVVRTDSMAPVMNCKECGNTINVIKGLKTLSETDETFSRAEERLKTLMSRERPSGVGQKQWRAQVNGALADFLNVLRSLEEVLAPPLRDIALCQQSTRRCMLALGNVRHCPAPAAAAPASNGVPS